MCLEFKNGKEFIREPASDDTFSMVITGDCCPWENAIKTIRDGRAADIISDVKPFLDSADLKIIQFESPLTNSNNPIDKSGPNLKCPPECLDLALTAGFDVALLANNHIGDHGSDAVMETIGHFNNAGIKTAGAGRNLAESKAPLKIQCRGINIAILNFAENEFGTAREDSAGCAPLNPIENIRAIKDTAQTADLVFVIIHGGHEHNPMPSPRMINTYRAFAESGAALVVNIHTHCPEGIELWNGVPIVYSPGNFFFPWTDLTAGHLSAMWWIGYLPKFYCDRNGVYALELMPYRFNNERLYALPVAEQKDFWNYIANLNLIISDPKKVRDCFEGWAAHNGSIHLSILRDYLAAWPVDLEQRDQIRVLLPPRNCFTCESHNDLITNYLRLIEERRVKKSLEHWPLIEQFQHPHWAEKYWRELQDQKCQQKAIL